MPTYPSKILLFGEYAVLHGAPALAVPFEKFYGSFTSGNPSDELKKFVAHILDVFQNDRSSEVLDTMRIKRELQQSIDFESNIPRGYGLGSSGALCAAIWARYGLPSRDESVGEIHTRLKKLEDYFHGQSSGIDPLVSYYRRPVYQTAEGSIQLLDRPLRQLTRNLWLLNMERSRTTAPLVDWFNRQRRHPAFVQALQNQYIPRIKELCRVLLEGGGISLSTFRALSRFQWKHFRPLIPEDLRKDWQKGLESKNWCMKLCGAGGGGMMLVYGENAFDPKELKWPLIPLSRE